jgi:hypothetical protein
MTPEPGWKSGAIEADGSVPTAQFLRLPKTRAHSFRDLCRQAGRNSP